MGYSTSLQRAETQYWKRTPWRNHFQTPLKPRIFILLASAEQNVKQQIFCVKIVQVFSTTSTWEMVLLNANLRHIRSLIINCGSEVKYKLFWRLKFLHHSEFIERAVSKRSIFKWSYVPAWHKVCGQENWTYALNVWFQCRTLQMRRGLALSLGNRRLL